MDAQGETLKRFGIGIAAISTDEHEDSRKLVERLKLKHIPLLADPELVTIDAWGVRMSGADIAVPTTFIVDADGRIRWRYVGETQADRPPVATLIEQARIAGNPDPNE